MASTPKKLWERELGKATLRLLARGSNFVGVVILGGQVKAEITAATQADAERQLYDAAARLHPHFVGYAGARNRFLHFFPGGFASPEYENSERRYKLNASQMLDKVAPLDDGLAANGLGREILDVFQKTGLLASSFEQAKLKELLLGLRGDDFIRGAANFALGDYEDGLAWMEKAAKPHGIASWPAVTFLPFLWRPAEHMFLKPTKTIAYAERVGHAFANAYASSLNTGVYASLLDLTAATRAEIEDMQPRDNIDIQSFVWVVGAYVETDRVPQHETST